MVSEIGNNKGHLCIYHLEHEQLKLIHHTEGAYKICHMTDKGYILALKKDKTNTRRIIEVYNTKAVIIKELYIPDVSKILSMKSSEYLMVLKLHSKKVVVVDLIALEILHIFDFYANFESPPYVIHKSAYFITRNNTLIKINFEKDIKTLSLLTSDSKHAAVERINVAHEKFGTECMGLIVIKDKDIVVFKNSLIEMFRTQDGVVEYKGLSNFKLTCCGIDISYVTLLNIS